MRICRKQSKGLDSHSEPPRRGPSRALSHGITRVAALARFLGLPREGLYGVWRGTAVNISLARLEWLRPRDWFQWDNWWW
jgi:hypothetical protein